MMNVRSYLDHGVCHEVGHACTKSKKILIAYHKALQSIKSSDLLRGITNTDNRFGLLKHKVTNK